MIFSNDALIGMTPSFRNDNDFLFGMMMTVIFDAVSIGRRQIETASKRSGDAVGKGIPKVLEMENGRKGR